MNVMTFKKAPHLVEGSKIQNYDHYVKDAWISTNTDEEVIIILTPPTYQHSGKYEFCLAKDFGRGLPWTCDTFEEAVKVAERHVNVTVNPL